MPLVSMAELLQKAYAEKYIVGAFSSWNTEMAQAIIEAAEEERSPVILESGHFVADFDYRKVDYLVPTIKMIVENASIPASIHLDHAASIEAVIQAIRLGVSSVMIDGSHLSLEENIALTRRVVNVAHSVGVSVEAEVGRIGKAEAGKSTGLGQTILTDPRDANRFVNETRVDALAISAGNIHGLCMEQAKIDFDGVKEIKKLVDIPLVLHGGTGIPPDAVRKLRTLGVSKINIGHAVILAFVEGIRKVLNTDLEKANNPRLIFASAREAMKNEVKKKMKLFGSSGKVG